MIFTSFLMERLTCSFLNLVHLLRLQEYQLSIFVLFILYSTSFVLKTIVIIGYEYVNPTYAIQIHYVILSLHHPYSSNLLLYLKYCLDYFLSSLFKRCFLIIT